MNRPRSSPTTRRRATLVTVLAACLAVAVSSVLASAPDQTPPPTPGARLATSPGLAFAPEGVPGALRGQEVFRVYRPLGTLSPEERARVAESRLEMLVANDLVIPEQVRVEHSEAASELWAGDRLIGLITDQEAEAAGSERRSYAEFIRTRIIEIVTETRAEYTAQEVTRGVVYLAVATVLLAVFVWGLLHVTTRLRRVMDARLERLHESAIEHLHLVNRATLARWLALAVRLVTLVLLASAALGWLEFALGSLPWTRPYARMVLPWLRAPFVFVGSSVIAALPNLFYIAVILLLNFALLRLVHAVFRAVGEGALTIQGFQREWAEPTFKLVRTLMYAITFVAAFPYIPGSSSPAFQGVSVFVGLVVSLSSSSAISNIIAGTILTYTGAFRMGDRVQISDTTGDVVKKSLLTTHLRTIKNEIVAIPNAMVLSGNTVNYTTLAAEFGLILHTTVTIGYDAPWRTVHRLLIEAALATDGIEPEPVPFVFQTALNDFYVSYEINAYTRRPHDMAVLYAQLHQSIQESFNKGGVEIMSPHYSALRDGNTVTTPEAHRPANYATPRFGVSVSSEPER